MSKKNIFIIGLLVLMQANLPAQTFDSTAYKNLYRKNFESAYFDEELTASTKIAGLSKAWAEAKFNFANFDLVPHLKWDSIYQAYIPRVLEAKTQKEYYIELIRFYTTLNDGHSLIIPPPALWDEMYAHLPIKTKLLDGEVVITSVDAKDETFKALKPGNIITRINGVSATEYAESVVAPYVSHSTPQDKQAKIYSFFLTNGNLSESLDLELKDPKGKIFKHRFKRISREGVFLKPIKYTYELLDPKTRLLTISTFNQQDLVPFLDSIFQELPHPENLIVDLRENGGGNGNNGFELLGYLTGEPFKMAFHVYREYQPAQRAWQQLPDKLNVLQYDWKPYKEPVFKGKVAVLAGPDTYSAAEDFLVSYKAVRRGVIIGRTTGGSTGQPLFYPLPFGGMGAVCAKRDLMTDYSEFVGKGIEPDISVVYSLKNFQAGKDEALEAAFRYFNTEM